MLLKKKKPKLIAIVGASGAGKSWLARRLHDSFGAEFVCLSLDDFYRDRSGLPEHRRQNINFDHPRAIDWAELERVLRDCSEGKKTLMPQYDFATHSRSGQKVVKPKSIFIVEGLWLLRRPSVRGFFSARIYLDCPQSTCLARRVRRDRTERKRSVASIKEQYFKQVLPMQERFVETQKRWADIVLENPAEKQIANLVDQLKKRFEEETA